MDYKQKNTAYIAYGSNLGDWNKLKVELIDLIRTKIGVIVKESKTYLTPPWGNTDQPYFKNGVFEIHTSFTAEICLSKLLKIENTMGRVRTGKWTARTIDLDILDFNNQEYISDTLTLPHPYAHLRQFVLEPFNEIAPNLILPNQSYCISELLNQLDSKVKLSVV